MADVLIHGVTGGREVAIFQAMAESPEVNRVELDGGDLDYGLDKFTGGEKPFVIVGPEAPLVKGVADYLRSEEYVVFGASAAGARYEASKSAAVKMARHAGVVHPDTFIAEGDWLLRGAMAYVEGHDPATYVIKADGLAGGKGVVLPNSYEEAEAVVREMASGKSFDGAGQNAICFAKRKHGPEVSAMVVVGGGSHDFMVLPLSQDHKRLGNHDTGPNTGGMGAYAPVPEAIVSQEQYRKILEKTHASLEGMENEGVMYGHAVLYMGLMMSGDLNARNSKDSDLIEYNVRLGDPETQVILPLLTRAGVDVYRLFRSAAEGQIERPGVDLQNIGYSALSVCLAADGYPVMPRKGDPVYGLDKQFGGVTVQPAGLKWPDGGEPVTNGGRVLYVTGVGDTISEATRHAYAAIGPDGIHFDGMQYRTDIAWQALIHERSHPGMRENAEPQIQGES